MSFLSTILLLFFLYIVFYAGLRLFTFWRKYRYVIKQMRDVQRNAANGFGGFNQGQQSTTSTYNTSKQNVSGNNASNNKIIPKDEGEYVEFEEI